MAIPGAVNIKGNRIQVSDSIGSRFRVAGLRFEDRFALGLRIKEPDHTCLIPLTSNL